MDNLNGFRAHGVTFHKDIGNQSVGDCVFCGKESHFYVNKENKLWDCKRCGKKGNFEDFLEGVAALRADEMSEDRLKQLAADRGLPAVAFNGIGIGWNGLNYTIPIRNSKGRVKDIRLFHPGRKIRATPTASLELFGAGKLVVPERAMDVVVVCEGEWDAIAFEWLRSAVGKTGYLTVGVPGASIFKDNWTYLFQNRDVLLAYDNDQPGLSGMELAKRKLTGVARSIRAISWPTNFPVGYDVRDLVRKLAVEQQNPDKAWNTLQALFEDVTEGVELPEESAETGTKLDPIGTKELINVYKKWLFLANEDALKVMYGTLMANKLPGDPVWLFMVAPPGGSKSELLMSLAGGKSIHAISSLTPHTLVSGANWSGGGDPSLLPKLGGKVLIIKDFTTLLTMNYMARDEIFGVLRDVYDGNIEKVFGNGVRRHYVVHFGILAGVTPAIEMFNVLHQSLGERFLKFRISGNWDHHSEEDKIRRALDNIGQENTMRQELQAAANRWMANAKLPDKLPEIPEAMKDRLVHLAKFSARLRGVVERDKFNGQVLYKPSSEVGTRIAKQLAKLGQGVAMFLEKESIDEEVYRLILRVALDTVPDRVEDIARGLWDLQGRGPSRTAEVVAQTRLPQTTVVRVLQDMNLLKLVECRGEKGGNLWNLSDKIAEHIERAAMYQNGIPEAKKLRMKLKAGVN